MPKREPGSTCALRVKQAPQNSLLLTLMFPWGLAAASCLSRRISKISKWVCFSHYCVYVVSWSFWDFCLHSFKSGSSIPYSPPVLPYASPAGLRSQMFSVFLSVAGWGAQCGAWTSRIGKRNSAVVIILPFVGHLLRLWVLAVLHLLPSCCVFLFIPLAVDKLFC